MIIAPFYEVHILNTEPRASTKFQNFWRSQTLEVTVYI